MYVYKGLPVLKKYLRKYLNVKEKYLYTHTLLYIYTALHIHIYKILWFIRF